ncbi:MAG: DUF58 domain-containing protein [Planctomyces sp.]
MKNGITARRKLPLSFSASSILQLLGGFAAILAAWVLPRALAEFENFPASILYALGGFLLLAGVLNICFGRQMAHIFQYIGMRSNFLLPREGVIYLGIMLMLAIAALLGHSNMLLLVFGMMAGPFVLNGWVVFSMIKAIVVRRQLPEAVAAGESFQVEIFIQNNKSFLSSRLIEIRDSISGQNVTEEGSLTFVCIPPQSTRTGYYSVRIMKRGLYRFGPVRISSRFPLGIGERGTTVSLPGLLHVHPSIGRLMPDWKSHQREMSETTVRLQSRPGLFEDEFHRIREFRPGDHPRQVHWRSTAKRGELMIREYDQHRSSDMTVILDLPVMAENSGYDPELAISFAATICSEQTQKGNDGNIRLMIAGSESIDLSSATAGDFRNAALNALSLCQPSARADVQRLLSRLAQSTVSDQSRAFLITPRIAQTEKWIEQLKESLDSHSAYVLSRIILLESEATRIHELFIPAVS